MKKSVKVNEPDIWRPLADFFTDMIAKYANEMDFDNLPDPDRYMLGKAMKEAYVTYSRNRNHALARFIEVEYAE